MELRNPRAPPRTDDNKENENQMGATVTPANSDDGSTKKPKNVANPRRDVLEYGATARDANDRQLYTCA